MLSGHGATPGRGGAGLTGHTVFYEPLWVFCRGLPPGGGLAWLMGQAHVDRPRGAAPAAWPCACSPSTASSRAEIELLALSPEEAGEKLLRGEIAAAAHPDLVGRARRAPAAGRARRDPGELSRADALLSPWTRS